jgi:hypothetical protein
MPETKQISIRLPISLWKQLRRLQEDRIIDSIQGACVRALEEYILIWKTSK